MIKECCVCGKAFDAQGKDKTCSKECRKIMKREWAKAYRERKDKAYNRDWMREYRKERNLSKPKEDTLIGLGYAERQRQKTLELVGKVRTTL